MKPTAIKGSGITVRLGGYGVQSIRIEQDGDLVIVEGGDIEEFIATVRKFADLREEPEPSPYLIVGGEDLRMTRMIAWVNTQQKKQDCASPAQYKEVNNMTEEQPSYIVEQEQQREVDKTIALAILVRDMKEAVKEFEDRRDKILNSWR